MSTICCFNASRNGVDPVCPANRQEAGARKSPGTKE